MKDKAMYFYLLAFVITVPYFGCSTEPNQSPPVVKNERMSVSPGPAKEWVPKKLGNQQTLVTVQFIDQAQGWVVSREGQIYLTSDGGETWQQRRVDMPSKSEVLASFFVDSLTGWISVVRMSPDVLVPNQTRTWLMKTEDGGNSWIEQYSKEAVQLSRLYFVSANEGWAVGLRTIKRETLQDDPFVLYSADSGKHWTVVSESLPKDGGGLEDAYYNKSLGLVALNSEGQAFSTYDRGEHWQSIAAVPDEATQTYFGRFGNLDERLWFLGGSSSYEGTYGVLAVRGPDNSWTKLKTRAYLHDIMFLTTDKVIACGFVYEQSGSHNEKRGVVLRSSDGGRSWVTDIATNSSAALTALARAGNHFWVIGENGYIAMLEGF